MTFWIHEISQSALAAAVATLGLVMLLELRSISRLRRAMDKHLGRVFEQLDLLRSENQQLLEVQVRSAAANGPAPEPPPPAAAPALVLVGAEARLMATLNAARARQAR
jgi:hypothetical protein